jgi:hypothetical protein
MASRTLSLESIEWYAYIADDSETTHTEWQAVCSDCPCQDIPNAYRMNHKPMNPRAGRSVYLEEKLTDADLDC